MDRRATICFHSPCFDGLVSAAIAADFLETKRGWPAPTFRAVNYELRSRWLSQPFGSRCAVVDFLYHPAVSFWADHHQTAFLDAATRQHWQQRASTDLIYDDEAFSCAGLLWRRLAETSDFRSARYAEMVEWADRIDAARYTSVEEAVVPSSPALRLNSSLAVASSDDCELIVPHLRTRTLDEIARLPGVVELASRAEYLLRAGLERFKETARVEADGIVVFDVPQSGALISRYAPYYFYPDARYSVGVVRWDGGAKVTAMRNPWKAFASVPLGRIAEQLGGGGHQRVGSVLLVGEHAMRARDVRDSFIAAIRARERERLASRT